MKLSLKKIKTYDSFQEETLCFEALLYEGRKKIAYCEN